MIVLGAPFATETHVLTDEQIKKLPTTPIEIISSQGEGKLIQIIAAYGILNNTSGAYVTDAGSAFVLNYTGGPAATSVWPWVTPMDTPGTWLICVGQSGNVGTGDFSLTALGNYYDMSRLANKGISIQDNFIDSFPDYTGGDPANSLTLIVFFTVIEI